MQVIRVLLALECMLGRHETKKAASAFEMTAFEMNGEMLADIRVDDNERVSKPMTGFH